MTRHVFGLMCVCALGAVPLVGCTESKEAEPDLEWPPNATVYFDQYGILTADCATDEDCTMVLGYYHARDRWVQMGRWRYSTIGRFMPFVDKAAVEAIGSLMQLVDTSAADRARNSTRDGKPLEEHLLDQASPKTRALLDAYAAGVNQWLDDVRNGNNGAKWPAELESPLLAYAPNNAPDWTPQDSLAVLLAIFGVTGNGEAAEVAAGAAREAIGDDTRFTDLWSREPLKKSSILEPGTYSSSALAKRGTGGDLRLLHRARPALERLHMRLSDPEASRGLVSPFGFLGDDTGSNNWVLGPSISANSNTLLCNDPHLSFSQPAVWYAAHLDAKTKGSGEIHTAGLTLAGLPWVFLGQNEDIAWGGTNTNLDLTDLYIEDLVKDTDGEPIGVMFRGNVVPFVRIDTTFDFNDGSSESRELLFVPHHGPVRELDADNDVAITLRWAGSDVGTDVNYLTEIAAATTVEAARAVLRNVTAAAWNFVVIDNTGNFGWFPYNRLPKRTWATDLAGGAPPWLPLDGTGAFEWEEFFDYGELPQAYNRHNGYVATANNDFTGALFDGEPTNDGHPPLQTGVASGYRHARIAEVIEASDEHTIETMQALIGDVHSLIGQDMTPTILDIANHDMTELSEEAQQVVNTLTSWSFGCPTGLDGTNPEMSSDSAEVIESAGCAAFHATLRAIDTAIVGDELSGRFPSFVTYFSIMDPSRLAAGDVYWDDVRTAGTETKFDIMGQALDAAGRSLVTRLGSEETQWAWGRIHGLILRSDLGVIGPQPSFNNPPPGEPFLANDGGLFTVDVAAPGTDYLQTAGPSTRLVCEGLASGVSCSVQLPGGQSSHTDSANYDDLLPLWLANQPIDLVFDIEEAKANAVRTVTFD